MKRWKAAVFSGWFFGGFLLIVAAGIYYVKSEMGVDLLKGRHLLIFSQEPQWKTSFEPPQSERRATQESNKVRRENFYATGINNNHG